MRSPRYALRDPHKRLAVAIYAGLSLIFCAFAIATADAAYLLYAIGTLAIGLVFQRVVQRRTMFVEFRQDQLRVRQWKTGVRATYSLIDSIISNRDEGEITIQYRLELPRGKVTTYRLPYRFSPKDAETVENELRRRVEAAKAADQTILRG